MAVMWLLLALLQGLFSGEDLVARLAEVWRDLRGAFLHHTSAAQRFVA